MAKYLLPLLFVMAIITIGSSKVSAQQLTGCLLSNDQIHYQENGIHGGVTNYNLSPNVLLSTVFCVEEVTFDSACKVNQKNNPANQGSKVTFYLYQCPIDDYVPLIILIIGGLGFFSIRKLKLETALPL